MMVPQHAGEERDEPSDTHPRTAEAVPGPGRGRTPEALRVLAEAVYSADDYDAVHSALTRAAVRTVPGCTRAGMLIAEGGRHRVAGATDEVAAEVHRMEIDLREGPCLDAELTAAPRWVADLRSGSPWPSLTARMLECTPIRSVAGFRIIGAEPHCKIGALNLFGDTPGALTAESIDHGVLIAAIATVALRAAADRSEAVTLREGLSSNREIGTAVGLLMGFHGVTAEQAFEILRATSQRVNVKVSTLAREMVAEHERGLHG